MKESEYTQQKRILIVGAGFAGVALAKKLHRTNYDVVLLDRNNHHTFQPLLYQVATGGLEAGSIAYPVRRIIRGFKNVRFYMADVHNVNFESKVLATSVGELPYDILVMANGSTNNFFNFQPVKDQLLPLKSVADALDIRSYIMQNLEKAIATFDSNERSELLNIAIIGGGPAGLEMAGALAEMKIHTLPKDFPQIDFNGMRITLFEAGPKLLGAMSEAASKHSLKYLEKLGVDVKLGAKVSEYSNHRIVLEDGATFATDTVIWTAGVKGNALSGLPKEAIALGNRVHVDAFNAVIGMQDVYAIGDVAAMISDQNPRGHPMLAPVAIQQAKNLARNLVNFQSSAQFKPYKFKNKGVMATIGRNKAVVDMPKFRFQGAFAWFVWMFVHIMSLVGFRNRIVTLIDWMGNYINYDRPLGLIIRPFRKK